MPKPGIDAARSASRLRRAVLVLARRLRLAYQGDALSPAKLSVVGQIHREGPMSPTSLAVREGVKLPSLTRMLAELERDGWLARTTDPADARRAVMSLTGAGRRRLIASTEAADAALARILARAVGADELAALDAACALLERIGDAVDEPAATRSSNRRT